MPNANAAALRVSVEEDDATTTAAGELAWDPSSIGIDDPFGVSVVGTITVRAEGRR